jgi:DNA repair exonuclease SbcCD nuclease subunit
LEAVVDLANHAEVDLVIIAGDLFDHSRVNDSLVSFAAEQLQRLSVDVAILPGNHDCLVPGSAFDRAELWENCANVRVFRAPDGATLDLPEIGVSLWGKSMDSYVADVQPLAGMPQPEKNGQWNIAIGHGYYVDSEPPLFPSYNITLEEITTSSGWDYIALGHMITFRCVCEEPMTYYSGSPSLSGTVAIIDLDEETGIQVTPHSLPGKYNNVPNFKA